jgi:hypothetical protein
LEDSIMKRTNVWGTLLILAVAGVSPLRAAVEEQFDATCRVSTARAMGTGCVFLLSEQYAAVLTNEHVVQGSQAVDCEFWARGHQSAKLPGQVYVSDPAIDVAVVLVPTAAFGGVTPRALPLGDARSAPEPGAALTSVGCANGTWATAFRGHVTRYEGGQMFFVPPPADGRSGSALLDDAGRIVGLVRIRTAGGEGGAVDIATLESRLNSGMRTAARTFKPAADLVAFGGCPGGTCPSEGCLPRVGSGLFGWRHEPAPTAPAAPIAPWPTLPAPQSKVDLGPVLDRLDRIAEHVAATPAPAPAPAAGPDAATLEVLKQLGGAVQQHTADLGKLRDDVPRIVDGAVKPVADKVAQIEGAVRPLEAIKQHLDQDIAAGGIKGRLVGDAEKLLAGGGGDSGLRTVLMTGGGTVGLLFLVGIGVLLIHAIHAHKAAVQAGRPTPEQTALQAVRTQLDAAAAKNPALAPAVGRLDQVGDFVLAQLKSLDGKLAAHDQALQQIALNTPAPGQAASSGM